MTPDEIATRRNELTRDLAMLYPKGKVTVIVVEPAENEEDEPANASVMLPRGQDPMQLISFLLSMALPDGGAHQIGTLEFPRGGKLS